MQAVQIVNLKLEFKSWPVAAARYSKMLGDKGKWIKEAGGNAAALSIFISHVLVGALTQFSEHGPVHIFQALDVKAGFPCFVFP